MPNPSVPFPTPKDIAGRNFWVKGDVRRWRAEVSGLPEPDPQPDDEHYLTSKQVKEMFGGVSDMWLWRRRHPVAAAKAA
jgi:hypothetical protein